MRYFFTASILAALTLALFWQPDSKLAFWQDSLSQSVDLQSEVATKVTNSNSLANPIELPEHASTQLDDSSDTSIEEFVPNPDAVASLRQARLKGDPRAPKLGEYHERETPTEEELADHEQYVEYEKRQQKRVYRAYVEASKIKTAQLRDMIELGKAEGVSEEEIAFAEEKIRGIEEMAITLQQDHPDIMEDSYQPPADWLIENLGKEPDSAQSDPSVSN